MLILTRYTPDQYHPSSVTKVLSTLGEVRWMGGWGWGCFTKLGWRTNWTKPLLHPGTNILIFVVYMLVAFITSSPDQHIKIYICWCDFGRRSFTRMCVFFLYVILTWPLRPNSIHCPQSREQKTNRGREATIERCRRGIGNDTKPHRST